MTTYDSRHVAVIGAGPRGLLVIERLCANQRHATGHLSLTVHAIDPAPAGSGLVWRSEQAPHLLMNTVASQVTVFTDTSVCIDGPVEPGPSLYDWACILRDWATATSPATTPPTAPGGPLHGLPHDLVPELAPTLQAEAVALGPDSYPTRRFYGAYLQYCFARTVANAPDHVTVRVHRSRAVAMADTYGVDTGPQGVRLEDGTRLDELEAVVLAQGHLPTRLTHREARAASLARIHHLDYRTPANPADVDLDSVQPGETVLIRGMGLSFFDYLAMLTTGRGGRFKHVQGRCRYIPSGREPRMVAFSRRGVPHHARGRNEKGPFGRYVPRLLTPEQICRLRAQKTQGRPVSFRSELWPLIAREVEAVYYGALVEQTGANREEFITRFLAATTSAELNSLLDDAEIPPSERWSWQQLEHPTSGITFGNRAHFRSWMIDYLSADLTAAQAGNLSDPLKSALDVLRDLRNEIRLVVDHGGIDGESYRTDLQGWYTPLNAYLSIGPPAERISEMIALLEAGMLDVTGPGTIVRIDPDRGAFVAYSTEVPGPEVVARTLIEARLPEPDLRRTTDPLLQHLLATAQCRTYAIPTSAGRNYESGGLAVGERPYRLVDQDGQEHPRRFAFGVPTESVHWVTAAGARPGVDSVSLADADAISRAVLELPAANGPAESDPQLRLGAPPRKRNEREGMVV